MSTDIVVHAHTGRPNPSEPVPTVVLSLGMGVDSAALLTRWLLEPDSRDFDLNQLLVITSQTGDEWETSRELMQNHLMPLMAQHQVRYVQVARAGRTIKSGVLLLDDSRAAQTLHLEGGYRLSQELLTAGTVAQSGGNRVCSIHAKGDVLDLYLAVETQGAPFRHMIGFESGEMRRAIRDAAVPGKKDLNRTAEYPLISWAWDRDACQDYLRDVFGVEWSKSACHMCPFALGSKAGRDRMVAKYRQHPEVAAQSLFIEHVALCLNGNQGIIAGDRLIDLLTAQHVTAAIRLLHEQLDTVEHAVYEVRRTFTRRRDGKYNNARSVRAISRGLSRTQAAELLATLGPADGSDSIARVWTNRRAPAADAVEVTGERFYVAAPATVEDKDGPAFASSWLHYEQSLHAATTRPADRSAGAA